MRNPMLILKHMTPQPEKKTVTIQIFHYFSRSKSNQTKIFGELIEFNMRNIFLQKSSRK